jgi:hypothetical protein
MLPRDFPKFGGFLINVTAKFSGIDVDIQVTALQKDHRTAKHAKYAKKNKNLKESSRLKPLLST